ncbi:MAG: type II secretion system F family protein [Chthonomonas sp.]|nr:type II secretion system F family protein [Chthonomonas sp.]
MQEFEYEGKDQRSQRQFGTQLAVSANEAIQILRKRGINVNSIRVAGSHGTPLPRHQAAPPTPVTLDPSPLVVQPTSWLPRTPWSSKRHYFLFNMLAVSAKAGVNMHQSLQTASNTTAFKPWETSMVRRWAEDTEQGMALHETMAKAVPPISRATVGMVRVGEVSGSVPDAMAGIAEHHHNNIRYDRTFWIFRFFLYYGSLSIPLAIVLMKGFTDAYAAYEKAGEGNVAAMISGAIVKNLAWPFGPIILAWWLLLFLGARLLMRPQFEKFRHWFGYYHPYMRGRAQQEGITAFTWALGRLSRAGIAPFSAWNLAAEAVPNAIVREKLLDMSRASGERTKLSDLVRSSGLFEPEYVSVIENAEYTGTLPDSLEYLRQVTNDELGRRTMQSKGIWAVSTILFGTIISLLIVVVMAYYWYRVFYGQVLAGLDATIILPRI